VLYKTTDSSTPDGERAILRNDPDLAIAWPRDAGSEPSVSDKDLKALAFRVADKFA
jgi:dTDP-4-dehydrorhamnose 3,5-epimerase